MSDLAIRVEHLGKRYRLGQRERYKTLRESQLQTVTNTIRAPFSEETYDKPYVSS